MKAKKLLTIFLLISLIFQIILLSGCSWIFAESEEPAMESCDAAISKIYSASKRVSLVMSGNESKNAQNEVKKLLEEKDVSFSYAEKHGESLVMKEGDANYLVEPTVWLTADVTDLYTFVDNTRWGSVVCVDMASFSDVDALKNALSELIYVYRYAGYEIIPPSELLGYDDSLSPGMTDDAANFPSHTTPVPLGVEESNPVNDNYFDDAVFIGDSITQKLQMYATQMRHEDASFLGRAKFLAAASLGAANSLSKVSADSLHPSYNGVKRPIWENVALMDARKVYIMLGVNDLTWASPERTASNLRTLIGEIKNAAPEADIYVQSVTPRISRYSDELSNQKIFEYNLMLYNMCLEEGWYFVDVAYAMRDENGCLPDALCSDLNSLGIHFTNDACEIWVRYLRTHTP